MNWRDAAVCARDNRWTERPRPRQLADCAYCPVRAQCLELALAAEEELCRRAAAETGSGDPTAHLAHLVNSALPVYGGQSVQQRAALLAERFGGPPAELDRRKPPTHAASCGTLAGATGHSRRGERRCEPCSEASRVYNRERRARRQAVAS